MDAVLGVVFLGLSRRMAKHASESLTSPRRIEAVNKQRQAVELRKAGASFAMIAEQLGYASVSGAFKAVQTALRKTLQAPADEVRNLELERLDTLLLALWPQARQGNQGAIDRVLRIMERRAKLLGLDAPTKVAPTDPAGERMWQPFTADDFARAVADAVRFEQEKLSGHGGEQ